MNHSNRQQATLISPKTLAFAISAALASQAQAQDASDENVMEEVIVTATKRVESMQDIPIAVTAISGETLTELNIVNVLDIEKTVPGMKVRYVGADPTIIMRGAGSAGTTDLAVPMYIDGLYRPRAGQALASYLDLERVEVLRGPQGTLFGRNTLGRPDQPGHDQARHRSVRLRRRRDAGRLRPAQVRRLRQRPAG